ncbi:cation diffusion facilitator family transporter [Ammoniphilus resinae]|uniref:Cation diffusion facilitator family transporter n=1 Tax=Ammoniphilus resinae TaxID=861532 RepID=A0ABS4GJX2_9BACL|nr:cation diffusion facilitator family transporter [Ammoniphilus resinae]MBP1930447.1 cation diffusion facilitator family transporter [Ammoniphilus resinae]
MKEERFQKAEFAAWLGIIGNIALAAIKGIIGMVANSKALIADAVHSASDVIGSFAVLIGLKAAQKPPDEDHPYGHGKAESIAAIIVSILLFIVGLEVGYSSLKSFFLPLEAPGMIAIYAAFGSIVVKEMLFRYKYSLGKKLNSQALIANAWEHRSDVYSSFAALVGIGGAILGGWLNSPFLLYLDPLAGLAVSILVLKMAYNIMKESIHNTLDRVIDRENAKELVESVERVEGVMKVNSLLARENGHYVIVDVKIGVQPDITVEAGHAIGKEVKMRLMSDYSHVHDVMVHVNPYNGQFPEQHTEIIQ